MHSGSDKYIYIVLQLFVNSVLLALYSVMVFTEHFPCMSDDKDDYNVTSYLEFAFKLGFSINLLDFIINALLILVVWLRIDKDLSNLGTLR